MCNNGTDLSGRALPENASRMEVGERAVGATHGAAVALFRGDGPDALDSVTASQRHSVTCVLPSCVSSSPIILCDSTLDESDEETYAVEGEA